ncbi:MAG: 30S ribosome-binding factor RbfA [Alphaproteobacteria bacterium]|nr:30S ribosome-binding factor RbfA [Alphaproteobacteria bacterium]
MRSRAPSQRQLRVGEELRHAVVRIFERGHFRDPDLAAASITVTEVRVSPDLKNATAFVTPLGGQEMDRVVAALNRARGYFRREMGRELALKFVPRIAFAADTSFDYSSRIDSLLHRPEVERDLDPGAEEPDEARGPGHGT